MVIRLRAMQLRGSNLAAVAVASLLSAACSLATARDNPVAVSSYSAGVQAYLNEEHLRAERYLDRALAYGSADPRVYYFRGLSKLARNQPYAAEADIRTGAAIEAGSGRHFGIGSALRSISSEGREMIDRIRGEMLHGARSEQTASGPAGLLRSRFQLPMEALATLDSPAQIAQLVEAARPNLRGTSPAKPTLVAEDATTSDPFVDDPLQADGPTEPEAAAAPPSTIAAQRTQPDLFGPDDSGPDESGPDESVAVQPSVESSNDETADVPAEARGSMKRSSILGVLSRAVGSLVPEPPAALARQLPGGAPGESAEGVDPFGGNAFEEGGNPFGDSFDEAAVPADDAPVEEDSAGELFGEMPDDPF